MERTSIDFSAVSKIHPSIHSVGVGVVALRLELFDGRIRTVYVDVIDRIDLNDQTEEIRLDGHTIGFIGRAGHIFVAQAGTRFDRAEECGQCFLWATAVAILIKALRGSPEPSGQDARAPEHPTDNRDDDTRGISNRGMLRSHERSRAVGTKW